MSVTCQLSEEQGAAAVKYVRSPDGDTHEYVLQLVGALVKLRGCVLKSSSLLSAARVGGRLLQFA